MSALTARSFSLSLFLHTTLVMMLALWFASSTSEIARSVPPLFTLVPNFSPAAPTSAPTHAVSVVIPVARPAAPVNVTPARAPTPPATLTPTKTALATNRASAPTKTPANLTIEEFRRLHGTPSPVSPNRQASATPATARVSESFPVSTSSAARPTQSTNENPDFTAGLLRDLRAAFVSAGISSSGLSTVVEFTFDEVGVFKTVRIVRSSGDATFDAAVLAAFAQVRARNFAPDATGQSYRVTFQTTGS